MKSKPFDFIIFGATGFTGKYCVLHAPKHLGKHSWAVAGRSEKKLKQMLIEISKESGEDFSATPLVIADVNDPESLLEMTRQCRVLINCCGPYELYGEQVIKACLENSTDYLDLAAEPQFMERMQLKYNNEAKDRGIVIVSACGFDSILCEMGLIFAEKNFPGIFHSAEIYISIWDQGPLIGPVVNYGTWHSMVKVYTESEDLQEIRKELFKKQRNFPTPFPTLSTKIIHKSPVTRRWYVPFANIDQSVSERTQRHFYATEQKRPIQIREYYDLGRFVFPSVAAVIAATFLFLLTRFKFGVKLLMDYPEIFSLGCTSKKGPRRDKYETAEFEHVFLCKGWKQGEKATATPTHQLVTMVKGRNPAYGATCTILLLSALTLLEERRKMSTSSGVLTPGVTFKETSLIDKLIPNGVSFKVIEELTEIKK